MNILYISIQMSHFFDDLLLSINKIWIYEIFLLSLKRIIMLSYAKNKNNRRKI
jgi:hypothetical protein